jgi:bifunctional DNA-binding transcriptional regulator/antitoxin component of YhaV-PrlF toxin-antitoxin module
MAVSLYEAVANGGPRTVQQRGVLMLPKQWREKYDLEQDDLVAVIENDDGHLEAIPPGTDTSPDYATPGPEV